MPTLKVDYKDGEKYGRIIESYRDEFGKTRMRTVLNLGKLTDKKIASLKRLGSKLYQVAGGDPDELTGRGIAELGRYNYGYVLVCKQVLCYYVDIPRHTAPAIPLHTTPMIPRHTTPADR